MKLFPIRQDDEIKTVPWAMLEEHRAQARANHGGRELEDIAVFKGGLTPCEAVAILEDREWERMTFTGATLRLRELVEAWQSRRNDFGDALAYTRSCFTGLAELGDVIQDRRSPHYNPPAFDMVVDGKIVHTVLPEPVLPDTFGNLAKAAALAKSMQRHVNGGGMLFNQYQTLINLIEQSQIEVTAMRARLRKS